RWAGQYRQSGKNLGVPPYRITEEVQKLIADARYWIENNIYPWDELGARFHHRLVSIHPFPNGNGRHARLLTDVLLTQHGQKRLTWGAHLDGNLYQQSEMRAQYLQALRKADNHSFDALIIFVKS
ncbi:MAG: mobile mystery protein B, partial [Deltaproteobacteria bacterium]|nr:mobile mystery protein B [Deltaproteobacteria bacterium]